MYEGIKIDEEGYVRLETTKIGKIKIQVTPELLKELENINDKKEFEQRKRRQLEE